MKLKLRFRILRGKLARLFGRPHKHLFWSAWRGRAAENPCLICGRTYHELGDEIKRMREKS